MPFFRSALPAVDGWVSEGPGAPPTDNEEPEGVAEAEVTAEAAAAMVLMLLFLVKKLRAVLAAGLRGFTVVTGKPCSFRSVLLLWSNFFSSWLWPPPAFAGLDERELRPLLLLLLLLSFLLPPAEAAREGLPDAFGPPPPPPLVEVGETALLRLTAAAAEEAS